MLYPVLVIVLLMSYVLVVNYSSTVYGQSNPGSSNYNPEGATNYFAGAGVGATFGLIGSALCGPGAPGCATVLVPIGIGIGTYGLGPWLWGHTFVSDEPPNQIGFDPKCDWNPAESLLENIERTAQCKYDTTKDCPPPRPCPPGQICAGVCR